MEKQGNYHLSYGLRFHSMQFYNPLRCRDGTQLKDGILNLQPVLWTGFHVILITCSTGSVVSVRRTAFSRFIVPWDFSVHSPILVTSVQVKLDLHLTMRLLSCDLLWNIMVSGHLTAYSVHSGAHCGSWHARYCLVDSLSGKCKRRFMTKTKAWETHF